MKKFVTVFLAMTVVLSLVACGSEQELAKKGESAIGSKIGESVKDAVDKGTKGTDIKTDKTDIKDDYDPATHWDSNPSELLWGGNYVIGTSEEIEGVNIGITIEVSAEDEYMYMNLYADTLSLTMAYQGSDCYIMTGDQAYHYTGNGDNVIVNPNLSLATFSYVETRDGYDVYDITEEGSESTQLLVNHETRTTERVVIDGQEYSVSELTERSFSVDRLSDVQEITEEEAKAIMIEAYNGSTPEGIDVQPE